MNTLRVLTFFHLMTHLQVEQELQLRLLQMEQEMQLRLLQVNQEIQLRLLQMEQEMQLRLLQMEQEIHLRLLQVEQEMHLGLLQVGPPSSTTPVAGVLDLNIIKHNFNNNFREITDIKEDSITPIIEDMTSNVKIYHTFITDNKTNIINNLLFVEYIPISRYDSPFDVTVFKAEEGTITKSTYKKIFKTNFNPTAKERKKLYEKLIENEILKNNDVKWIKITENASAGKDKYNIILFFYSSSSSTGMFSVGDTPSNLDAMKLSAKNYLSNLIDQDPDNRELIQNFMIPMVSNFPDFITKFSILEEQGAIEPESTLLTNTFFNVAPLSFLKLLPHDLPADSDLDTRWSPHRWSIWRSSARR